MDEHPNCDARFSDRFSWKFSHYHLHYVHFYSVIYAVNTLSEIIITLVITIFTLESSFTWGWKHAIHSHILGMMHEVHAAWTSLFIFLVRWGNMSIFTHLFYHDVSLAFHMYLNPLTMHTHCVVTLFLIVFIVWGHIFSAHFQWCNVFWSI